MSGFKGTRAQTSRLIAAVWMLCASPLAGANSNVIETANQSFGLPFAFEQNRGQLSRGVKYSARGPGYTVFLTSDGATLVLQRRDKDDVATQAIRFVLKGDASAGSIKAERRFPFTTNYFLDGARAIAAPSYAAIRYSRVYPGIDLVFHGSQNQLEYDFTVEPGGNPGQIAFGFEGADSARVTPDGGLSLATQLGNVEFGSPLAYQQRNGIREPVTAKYSVRADGRITFQIGDYDRAAPLIIDPILAYSSLVWGAVNGVAVDPSGNTYIAGLITTADLPASGGYQTSLAGTQDAYVAKIGPNGNVVYATYLGARRASSAATGIAVDSVGNAYITGTTSSASFPHTTGAYQTTFASGATAAAFATKLNSTGNGLVYSSLLNGISAPKIRVDTGGYAYVAGQASPVFATSSGAFQRTAGAFGIARFNPDGKGVAYATFLGPSAATSFNGLAIDGTGNVYVTGSTTSSAYPVANAYQSGLNGTSDAFVTKINPTGSAIVYSTFFGGERDEIGNAVAVNSAGEAFVTGRTNSDSLPTTFGVVQGTKGYPGTEVTNAFVAKFTSSGNALLYSTYLGGKWCLAPGVFSCLTFGTPDIDAGTAIAIDAAGFAYVGGYATSILFPLKDQIQATGPAGRGDDNSRQPFLARFSPNADRLIYSIVLGARATDEKTKDVIVDGNGVAYAVGFDGDPSAGIWPLTPGAPLASNTAGFLIKVNQGAYPTTVRSSSNPVSSSQQISLTAEVLGATAGGTVSFKDGANLIGTAAISNGIAVLATTLAPGSHRITAVNSSDGKTSPPIFQVVMP